MQTTLPTIAQLEQQIIAPEGPLTVEAWYFAREAHRDALGALELEHATLHDARHSYAVNNLREGMNPQVVAHQLGHRDAHLVYTVHERFLVLETD